MNVLRSFLHNLARASEVKLTAPHLQTAKSLQRIAVLSIVAICSPSAIATPTDIAMSHNFGRFVETCGQFDLQIAFARGQVTVQAPKTIGGGNLLRYTKADARGAFTASVGTDECSFTIRFERLAP